VRQHDYGAGFADDHDVDHDDTPADYVFVRRVDHDNLAADLDDYEHIHVVNAARDLVHNHEHDYPWTGADQSGGGLARSG
jgi:hypothetical protein